MKGNAWATCHSLELDFATDLDRPADHQWNLKGDDSVATAVGGHHDQDSGPDSVSFCAYCPF
jgi:hypothetical protein